MGTLHMKGEKLIKKKKIPMYNSERKEMTALLPE